MNIIADLNNLSVAIEALRAGKTVAYPTETSYGFGCDATNREAVSSIFAIKGREAGKPVLVVVASVEDIKPYVEWNEQLEKIAAKYWPGPLTVIAKASAPNVLADGVISADGAIAFRVTSHPLARELAAGLGKPLVSTSANKAGEPPLYSATKIKDQFTTGTVKPDVLIDAGDLPEVLPSTIIKLVPGGFEVVRQGTIIVEL